MPKVKKNSKGGAKASPKPITAKVLAPTLNVRINKKSYIGERGDEIKFIEKWHFDKLKDLGLVK